EVVAPSVRPPVWFWASPITSNERLSQSSLLLILYRAALVAPPPSTFRYSLPGAFASPAEIRPSGSSPQLSHPAEPPRPGTVVLGLPIAGGGLAAEKSPAPPSPVVCA